MDSISGVKRLSPSKERPIGSIINVGVRKNRAYEKNIKKVEHKFEKSVKMEFLMVIKILIEFVTVFYICFHYKSKNE